MEDHCYMPIDVTVAEEYFTGYGKKEIKSTAKTAVIMLIISIMIGIICSSIIYFVITAVIGVMFSAMLNRKIETINLTTYDMIKNYIRWFALQKEYHYKYYNEWGHEP